MTQLSLFNEADDIVYAMSLKSEDLSVIRNADYASWEWIRNIRNAVHTYNAQVKYAKAQMEKQLATAGCKR